MGAIAQHHVEEDDAGGRIVEGFFHTFDALSRVDHWVRMALGVDVVTEVDDHVAVVLEHKAFGLFRRNLQIQGVLDEHRRFVGQGAAGVIGFDRLVIRCVKYVADSDRHTAVRDVFAAHQGDGQAGRFVQRVAVVEVFFVLFRFFTEE